jgi:hypothetical protein
MQIEEINEKSYRLVNLFKEIRFFWQTQFDMSAQTPFLYQVNAIFPY